MRKKQLTAEQIIAKLREAEVAPSQRGTVPEACRKLGIVELFLAHGLPDHNACRGGDCE